LELGDEEPVDATAARLVAELQEGIGPETLRPGIIGEIGTTCPLHPREEKVLRAAARAQLETGVAITLHLSPPSRIGHQVLDILEAEGANLARVVAGHLDENSDDLDYQRSLADRGCFLEYDDCGYHMYYPGLAGGDPFWLPSDRERARAIAALHETRYGDQLLLSQDVCAKTSLRRFGGHGYGHLLRSFTTYLHDEGLGEREIHKMMVDNPGRMLTGA
jgi:phosphotriesterase-related protein